MIHVLLQALVLLFERIYLVAHLLEVAVRSLNLVVLLLGFAFEVGERCLELVVNVLRVGFVLVDVKPELLALRVALLEGLHGRVILSRSYSERQ